PLTRRIGDHQVEYGERVPQGAVGLLGDEVKRLGFCGDVFSFGDLLQVRYNVADLDPVEIEYLAARQDGREHFVLFRCGKDENGVWRWLFQRLEKRVEGSAGQHVNFVDDVDLVLAVLRRVPHLVDQVADVVHRIVGCGVQFEDVQRIEFRLIFEAVDQPCDDPRAGGFAHAAGTAKEECLRQLVVVDGIFQRGGDVLLTYHL